MFVLGFIIFLLMNTHAQYPIIPKPLSLTYGAGELNAGRNVRIHVFENGFEQEATYLTEVLESRQFKVDMHAVSKPVRRKDFIISIKKNNLINHQEGYELKVNEDGILLAASSAKGIFRGMMTLLQMLPVKARNELKLPYCSILDQPVSEWRGLMLDVSRHFFTVDEVKKFIDRMARYKFSIFHWHLTDDEGWRIQINAYPQLTEKGAWRVARTGKFGTRPAPQPGEPTPYGGFYTQDEIREVIQYAQKRHITIVPEIDVPGHSMALLAAMPELSTKKEIKHVSCGFKFSEWYDDGTFKMLVENMLNPSDPRVYEVLDTIFGEVAALFPGEYIHAGGDECYHGYWMEDEGCKKLMQENKLANAEELQSYFMSKVNDIIKSKGKKMIGWDEILYGGLAEGAAVMSWRGTKGGIEAAKKGHKVVMSPTTHAYLDYTQGDHSLEFPIYASLSLKKSYELNVVPDGVDSTLVMGGQGNLWTEHVPTLSHAYYMAYPRAMALSEALWTTKENRNWNDFTNRLETHFDKWSAENLSICKSLYDPLVKISKKGDNEYFFEASTELPGGMIKYTLDNTFPAADSPVFDGTQVAVPEGEIILRVAVFRDNKPMGRTVSLDRSAIEKRAK